MNAETATSVILVKEQKLKEILSGFNSLAIAYSGGVDSTYLAAVAHDVLGENVQMIIADSPSLPRSELETAQKIAGERKWKLKTINTFEHLDKKYQENSGDRCYYCKSELFNEMEKWCSANKISAMAYGAIIDDLGDHRPGSRAASEHKVLAPLQEAELSKDEIRKLSLLRNLPTSSKASFACLASRLPVGESVTVEKLSQIEMAEELIKKLNFSQYRARHHGDLCRIEVAPDEVEVLLNSSKRDWLVNEIKKLGYKFVTLDLSGYKTGSTNGYNNF